MAKDSKKGLVGEFKEFIARGNVVDMAVGVIIGGAFKAIADSLVADVIMPLVSMLTGGVDFKAWKWVLKAAVMNGEEVVSPEVAVNFGTFLSAILSFFIVALAVFMMVKAINKLRRKKEEAPAAPPAPSNEEKLLTEIRDLLKK